MNVHLPEYFLADLAATGDAKATPTKLFATQVPAFWNGSQLETLLTSKGVEINAQSTTATTSVLAELLLGFGPTLLIVGLLILVFRRAAKACSVGAIVAVSETFS